jgi:LysM repeat protein
MGLAHASIEPIRPKDDLIEFQFNPAQYTLEASNQLAEIGVPGLRAPVLQFVRGASRILSLEMFVDAYEGAGPAGAPIADVTDITERMYGLLAPTAQTGAPPICMFAWQNRRLQCVVEKVSGHFTLFGADGAPLRATLAVTLREFVDASIVVRRGTAAGAGPGATHTVTAGETLSSIAQRVYGDAGRWRQIATANAIANPRKVRAGQILVIPPKGTA